MLATKAGFGRDYVDICFSKIQKLEEIIQK
jgi:hypothetical protein